jgi:hypothetical protein
MRNEAGARSKPASLIRHPELVSPAVTDVPGSIAPHAPPYELGTRHPELVSGSIVPHTPVCELEHDQ